MKNDHFQEHISHIHTLCTKHHVKQLFAFGSVLTDRFRAESDIDLVVQFEAIPLEEYVENYFDLKFSLEDLFDREVDLLEQQAIKNPYLKSAIDQNKARIYGSGN